MKPAFENLDSVGFDSLSEHLRALHDRLGRGRTVAGSGCKYLGKQQTAASRKPAVAHQPAAAMPVPAHLLAAAGSCTCLAECSTCFFEGTRGAASHPSPSPSSFSCRWEKADEARRRAMRMACSGTRAAIGSGAGCSKRQGGGGRPPPFSSACAALAQPLACGSCTCGSCACRLSLPSCILTSRKAWGSGMPRRR